MDHKEVSALLSIVSGCAEHSGKLTGISNAAMTRLMEINDELRQASMEAAREARKAEVAAARDAATMAALEAEKADAAATKPSRQSETDKVAVNNMRRA